MGEYNLKKLHELVIDNDEEATKELIETFQPLIYKNSYINGNLDLDCVQELNIKLYNCAKKFDLKCKEEIEEYLLTKESD